MARVATPNTAEISIRGLKSGQQVENTFFYKKADAWDQDSLDALTAAVSAYVHTNWVPLLPSDWEFTQVYAADLTADSGLQSTNTTNMGDMGTATGTPYPNNVSVVVGRKTGLAGRSHAGRIYWMGLSENQAVTANVLATTVAAAIAAALIGLDGVAIALDLVPVVVSLFKDGAPRAEGVVTAITNWVFTDHTFDTRRRRMPGNGI